MSFLVSSQHLNKRCGLHLKEYQKPDPGNPEKLGIINSKGKFTACNCREHLTREVYNEIIPKIVCELCEAGLHKTLEHFNRGIDIKKEYENLKKDNIDVNSITAQKTTKSNSIVKSRQYHLYDVKDHKGLNIEMNWNEEGLIKAFKQLDKPNVTVNANMSELLKKLKYSPVSVYSPIMTKRILEELGCRTVLDPCIGWGGRMVGTTCLDNGKYTGCEPCTTTFQGLERIKNDLDIGSQVNLINKPVEEALDNELKDMVFDCCLTSPPYYDLEIYSDEDTQSINKFPTYELWLEKFIDPIIKYVTEHCTKFSCWSVKDFKTDQVYEFQKDVVKIHDKYGWVLDREYGIKKSTKNGSVMGDITYVFKKSDENIEIENSESEPDLDVENSDDNNNVNDDENIDSLIESLSESSETNLQVNMGDVVEDSGCNDGDVDNSENMLDKYSLNYVYNKIPSNLTSDQQIIYKLLDITLNDTSSGSFRENMTCKLCGYNCIPGKLGYDAEYEGRNIEIKPQNGIGKKIDGHGNFTDFTHKRFDKYLNDNTLMCVSGFYEGKIMYIFQFDFNSPRFINKMKEALDKHLPDGDLPSKYCRSGCSFGWNLWKDANNVKAMFINNNISDKHISKKFLKYINSMK